MNVLSYIGVNSPLIRLRANKLHLSRNETHFYAVFFRYAEYILPDIHYLHL